MILFVAVAVIGGVIAYRAFDGRARFDSAVQGVRDALKEPRTNNCLDKIPFKPGALPPGWKRLPRCGSPERTGGVVKGHGDTEAIGFFQAREGFVYVVRGEWAFAQTGTKRIKVLGKPALIGDIHEGFSVRFKFEDQEWTLVAYIGPLPRKQLEDFATSLHRI
jgi:hypothetical protein